MVKKVGFILSFALIFTMMIGVMGMGSVYASDPIDLQDSLSDISNSNGVIGDDAKQQIAGLGKDGMDIVGIIVMAIVTISGLWMTIMFTRTENSTAKTTLKGAIVMHILGIVWLANYFGLMDFGFEKLQIF